MVALSSFSLATQAFSLDPEFHEVVPDLPPIGRQYREQEADIKELVRRKTPALNIARDLSPNPARNRCIRVVLFGSNRSTIHDRLTLAGRKR